MMFFLRTSSKRLLNSTNFRNHMRTDDVADKPKFTGIDMTAAAPIPSANIENRAFLHQNF